VIRVPGGPDALVERLRADDIDGDVELLGGPSLIRALWERDAIDQLGLIVLRILFGEGLPLFPLAAGRASPPLKLVSEHVHPDGALELFYERP
jgi:dihydrofolate reductase